MQAVLPPPSSNSDSSPACVAGRTAADDAPRARPEDTVAGGQAPRASASSLLPDGAPLQRTAPAGQSGETTGQNAGGGFADHPAAAGPALADPLIWLNVTAEDDSATLHSRLERANDARLGLVLAPDARVLRRPLDFRILARLAAELGLDLTVATADVDRQRLAREFGLRVCTPPREPRWRVRRSTVLGALAAVAALAAAAVGLPRTAITLSPAVAPLAREAVVAVDLGPAPWAWHPASWPASRSWSASIWSRRAPRAAARPWGTPRRKATSPSTTAGRARRRPGREPAPQPTAANPVPGASGLAGLLGHNPSGRPASPPATRPEPTTGRRAAAPRRARAPGRARACSPTTAPASSPRRRSASTPAATPPCPWSPNSRAAMGTCRPGRSPPGRPAVRRRAGGEPTGALGRHRPQPHHRGGERPRGVAPGASGSRPGRGAGAAGERRRRRLPAGARDDDHDARRPLRLRPGPGSRAARAGATVRAQGIAVPRRAAIETAGRQWRQQIPTGPRRGGCHSIVGSASAPRAGR